MDRLLQRPCFLGGRRRARQVVRVKMTDDEQEANSIKWNVARIARLSSGNFALLTHYVEGRLDILKIGTLAEIEALIPTEAQCACEYAAPRSKLAKLDLADLGL